MPYVLLLALVLAACSGAPATSDPAPTPAPGPVDVGMPGAAPEAPPADSLDALLNEINLEIGDAGASSVSMCRVLPLGHKPCGGPAGYVVFSAEASDEARLQQLTTAYTRAQRARNEALGLMSDCSVMVEPEPALVDGRCVEAER